MALIKLGSTFQAAQVKVGVAITKDSWELLRDRLKEMGLDPKVCDVTDGRIWFSDKVALSYNPLPPHIPKAFTDVIHEFDPKAKGLGSGKEITMRGPPTPESCRVGEVKKRCPTCDKELGLIGPIPCNTPERRVFISPHHLTSTADICEDGGLWYIEQCGRFCWSVSPEAVPDAHCDRC